MFLPFVFICLQLFCFSRHFMPNVSFAIVQSMYKTLTVHSIAFAFAFAIAIASHYDDDDGDDDAIDAVLRERSHKMNAQLHGRAIIYPGKTNL